MTYRQVAEAAGSPFAWRAIGNILNKNQSSKIPCHRVIKSNGLIGGYKYGQKRKIKLLKNEGIKIKSNKIINKTYIFKNY